MNELERGRSMADSRISVVVLTFNRLTEVHRCLTCLLDLPEQPAIIAVDNGSNDGTADHIAASFPSVTLVRSLDNLGAAGRNLGVARVTTPYVAFCDDDTWWEPGALRAAADLLDAHPRIAVLSARLMVGPRGVLDPTCIEMGASPLRTAQAPGPSLIGFMAGAAVMRTRVFREIGGYEPRLFIGAEESLFALDAARLGWQIIYASQVIAHHVPSPLRSRASRQILLQRNRICVAWLRLPAKLAWQQTEDELRQCRKVGSAFAVLMGVIRLLPWLVRARRVVPASVSASWARVRAQHREQIASGGLARSAEP